MSQSEIITWLNFALQQMAAESYLNDPGGLLTQLSRGNNRVGFDPSSGPLLGATRFTNVLSDRFIAKYDIVHHHANDATGFSATLLQERDPNGALTNNFTLSFRSTEYRNQNQGGDWERDGLPGADGEIFSHGFALGQLVSMEKYYQQLKAEGLLPQGVTLSVTGSSLGGHLATVFTELHANEIAQIYTFNGAGHGNIAGGTPGLSDGARIAAMLESFSDQLMSQGVDEQSFASGATGNLYTDSRYQAALHTVLSQYQLTSRALSDIPRSDGAFAKITQLVGHATHGDTEYVANSGIHAAETAVFIEDQPDFDGFGGFFGANGDFGTTHSLTLIVDSLAVQELFQSVAPTLTKAEIEAIVAASSNQTASGFVGTSGVAEGNSLEHALDALGKLFVPNYTPTPSGRQTGDFGSLAFRTPFYEHLAAVKTALNGHTYQIVSLVGQPIESIKGHALLPDATGTAYRYALKELNPFVVLGANYTQFHNPGDLDLYDPETGNGSITLEYLRDRATFLESKLAVNHANASGAFSSTYFKDNQSGYEIGLSAAPLPQSIFGKATDETIDGSVIYADRPYGGDGQDTINGNGGKATTNCRAGRAKIISQAARAMTIWEGALVTM